MQLKTYQQTALEQLGHWLDALAQARAKLAEMRAVLDDKDIPAQLNNYPGTAWAKLQEQGVLPEIAHTDDGAEPTYPSYIERTAENGEPIPHVCMKIPTGGGKTLLGVAALDKLNIVHGLVLWVVPSKAIYEQTMLAFRNREHPYRQLLEKISGGRVKLLEKSDRFTSQDIAHYLCVMMLMLPSVNRQKGREFLKIFRDSGGYTSFFPPQDEVPANREFMARYGDVETSQNGDHVKQSLFNVLKITRPYVILDEAHKAYGAANNADNEKFVTAVNRLNPHLVLELSATPKLGISNILVNIGGQELKDEAMIKLPIEVHNFGNSDWKRTLAESQHKLQALAAEAVTTQHKEHRYIRPIALVRVQRVGVKQRDHRYIHADDVREYLIKQLAVRAQHIRIQTGERKELAHEDLLSELSEVRWIITKDALKEGWDCSFAYVLVLLDNTTATTAITQMVGRVMRQPQARLVNAAEALNRCYIYCYNADVSKAVASVRSGLAREGLSGLAHSVINAANGKLPAPKTVSRRQPYRKLKIMLPQVLHRHKRSWRPLDYDREILAALDWGDIQAGAKVTLSEKKTTTVNTVRVNLIEGELAIGNTLQQGIEGEQLTLDYFVRRLLDLVPNPWQAARIARKFIGKHEANKANLLQNRVYLSEVLRQHQVYPDFIVCSGANNRYLVLETKGMHLKDNPDQQQVSGA